MKPYFIVTETFDPDWGDQWKDYLSWSKIDHLKEVVSLDKQLCPFISDIRNEDIENDSKYFSDPLAFLDEDVLANNKKYRNPFLFTESDKLYAKAKEYKKKNILCIFKDPQSQPIAPSHKPPFKFLGYDILDKYEGNSILTNGGGYPNVFENAELTPHGLVETYNRAFEIRTKLQVVNRSANGIESTIWAIFRMDN